MSKLTRRAVLLVTANVIIAACGGPPPAASPAASPVAAAAPPIVSGEIDRVAGRQLTVATNTGVPKVRMADNANMLIEGQGAADISSRAQRAGPEAWAGRSNDISGRRSPRPDMSNFPGLPR